MLELVAILIRYFDMALGGDDPEPKLRAMALASDRLAADLRAVNDQIAGASARLNSVDATAAGVNAAWSGEARSAFDKMLQDNHLDAASMTALIRQATDVGTILLEAADATKETKHACQNLIRSVVIMVAEATAVSLAMAAVTNVAAPVILQSRLAAIAADATASASRIIRVFGAIMQAIAKALALLGRLLGGFARITRLSKLSPALRLSSDVSLDFKTAFLRAWRGYWKTTAWSTGGNYAASVAGTAFDNVVTGRRTNPFALSAEGLAELLFVGSFGGLTGPLGSSVLMQGLRPVVRNLAIGALAGGVPTGVIDRLYRSDPKPWLPPDPTSYHSWSTDSALFDVGLFSTVAGSWNAGVGRVFSGPRWAAVQQKFPPARMFANQSTFVQGSVLGFLPSTALRAVVPFSPPTPPPQAPAAAAPPPVTPLPAPTGPVTYGGFTVAVSPAAVGNNSSLWQIAQAAYGDGSLWPRIYDANRAVLGASGPSVIHPGQQLYLPPVTLSSATPAPAPGAIAPGAAGPAHDAGIASVPVGVVVPRPRTPDGGDAHDSGREGGPQPVMSLRGRADPVEAE